MEVPRQLHEPAVLSPEKKPPVPTEQNAAWAQNRSGRSGEDKNPCSYRQSNPRPPVRSQVTTLTELTRLYLQSVRLHNSTYQII
jgi:hypothetical protein